MYIRKFVRQIITVNFLLLGISVISRPTPAKTVYVSGWPYPTKLNKNDIKNWPNDPIINLLACPALTRLNMFSGQSEPYLIDHLEEAKDPDGFIWLFKWSEKLRWWNQMPITALELAAFVRQSIVEYSERAHVNELPKFSVLSKKGLLKIKWYRPPPFGPYFLNDFPLYKMLSDKIICSGPYSWESDESQSEWEFTAVAPISQVQRITLSKTHRDFQSNNTIHFKLPYQYPQSVHERAPHEPIDCLRTVDFPIFSVLTWNPESKHAQKAAFRKAITHLIPRGTLLRSGAGYLGDLVSAPILRAHPGYNPNLLVRTYDQDKGLSLLYNLGYKSSQFSETLVDKKGQALEIFIFSPNSKPTLLSKVVADTLQASGVKAHITHSTVKAHDGALSGIIVPLSGRSLAPLLTPYLASQTDKARLERQLGDYEHELTLRQPNFHKLATIHEWFYKIEPATIFMQHRSCVDIDGKTISKIIIRNPDWFLQLINNL